MAAPTTPAPAERSVSRAKQRDYSYVRREIRRIAIFATAIFIVALLFAPRRGIVSRWWLTRQRRRELAA